MKIEPHQLTTCLSDITRLRIIALLHSEGELCVCQIVSTLDTSQPKVSKHLGVLRSHGIITQRRQGKWMHYKLDPEIPAWANLVIHHLVSGCATRFPYLEDSGRFDVQNRVQSCV